MHQTQSYQYLIGSPYEPSAGRQYRQCFLLDKSGRKITRIFFRSATSLRSLENCIHPQSKVTKFNTCNDIDFGAYFSLTSVNLFALDWCVGSLPFISGVISMKLSGY
jgi:hypothetical protein